MSDYISREDAIQAYEDSLHGKGSVYGLIGKIPSADVRENIHGEWIEQADNIIYCSECLAESLEKYDKQVKSNYCPNCGADMRGDT